MDAMKKLSQRSGSSFLTKSFMVSTNLSMAFKLFPAPQRALATHLAVSRGGRHTHRLGTS